MKSILVFVIATFLLGCKKQLTERDIVPIPRHKFLTVRLTSPKDGQAVSVGHTVSITATVSGAAQLQKVRLLVTNKATGAEELRLEKTVDGKAYNLSKSFTPQVARLYVIKVEAWDQHNDNAETEIGIIGD